MQASNLELQVNNNFSASDITRGIALARDIRVPIHEAKVQSEQDL
jgi:hypothetical protein